MEKRRELNGGGGESERQRNRETETESKNEILEIVFDQSNSRSRKKTNPFSPPPRYESERENIKERGNI